MGMGLFGMNTNRHKPNTVSMDVMAKNGTVLRLTVTLTDAGHVELDSLLEVEEYSPGDDDFLPLTAFTVKGFLEASDDSGRLTLVDPMPPITVDRPMMIVAGDWLQTLAESGPFT